jgi:hypothetical protein
MVRVSDVGRCTAGTPRMASGLKRARQDARVLPVCGASPSSDPNNQLITMMTFLMFVGGLALLVIGAEALVPGGAKLALSIGMLPLVVAIACMPVFVTGRSIARWEGAVFIGYYVAYTAFLILAAQTHDALPVFSNVMLYFAVPITVLTMVVLLIKEKKGARPTG